MHQPESSTTVSSGTLGPLLRLSVPLITVNLGQQLMGVVDTALAGRVDELSLAATGLGNTIFMLGAVMGIGLVMGVDPLISQALGANRFGAARRTMWQGIYAGLLATLPLVLFMLFLGQMLEVIGIGPALASHTRLYVAGRLLSIVPVLILMSQRSYLQSAHLTRPIVYSMLVANLFNFVADWVLIFGDAGLESVGLTPLGIPAYGVAGIGAATTVACTMQALFMAAAILRIPSGSGGGSIHAPDWERLTQVFRVGVPVGFQLLSELGVFAAVSILAGTMGTTAMAAHQVAIMLAATAFMVPLAIGAATSVQVGRAIGRRDHRETRRAGLAGIGLGATFMLMTASLMWIFPDRLTGAISGQAAVVEVAAQLVLIAGAFQVFDGIQAVASGALRGAGMTRWAMAANIIAYWVIGFPVSLILGFWLDMGPQGLWWGLTVGLAVAAVALTLKFESVSRRPIEALGVG